MSFFSALSGALIHSTWQVTVLGLASFVVRLLLRGNAERYLAAMVTLALQLAWPLSTFISLLTAAPSEMSLINPAPIFGWVPMLWCLGASLMLVRVGVGLMAVSRWSRRGTPVDESLVARFEAIANQLGVRGVSYLVDQHLTSPVTIGFFKPLIFLPVSLVSSMPVASLEMLVAHELMHIRRYDYLVNVFQSIIEALLFFHPAVWWASKCARDDRELCCDEGVVAHHGDAHGYARALLALAHHQQPASAPALAATGGSLMNRIVRLLGPRSKSSMWVLGAVIIALGAGTALAVTLRASTTAVIPVSAELKTRFTTLCQDIEADACNPRMAEVPPEDRATVVFADLGEQFFEMEQFLGNVSKHPANQRAEVLKASVSAALGTQWECAAFDAAWAGETPACK